MKMILQGLALLVGLTAFLPFLRSSVWWIRGFDFPRMQMLAAGLVLGVFLVFLGIESWLIDGGTLGVLALSSGIQAWWMRPYSKLASQQVLSGDGKRGVSLLIANVLMSNRNADRLLDLIREKSPDIVIAVETDSWWTDRLRQLSGDYPQAVEVPQDDTYGMVMRSRLPLLDPAIEYLIKPTVPSIHTRVRLRGGEVIHLHAVHPKPPFPDEDSGTRDRDAELLIVGKRVEKRGGPTVVAGDLNDVAWSETTRQFQKISGLLDPRIGRGRFSTFHAGHWWLRWPLDHVFVSDHFRLSHLELQPPIGSDHFPILAAFSFEPDGQDEQSAPEKGPEDEREAREKISEATEQDR